MLVLAGALDRDEVDDAVIATTSLWYLRLVAAISAPPSTVRGPGRLSRLLNSLPAPDRQAALARVLDPDPALVEVLHPMRFAAHMARMQREHHLNLLAAEMVAAAVHHRASILVASPNAGGPIERAARDNSIVYEVRHS